MGAVADTCLVLFFFLELTVRCEYKAELTFTTCFVYEQRVWHNLKRVLNIRKAFETLTTCFEYLQRVWNI